MALQCWKDGPMDGTTRPARGTARARILETAARLFYTEGIRSISADRIIAEAATTKVTFYRSFRSKDDLVVAYIDLQSEQTRSEVDRIRAAAAGPCEALRGIAAATGGQACRPGFRGCAFINAAAEYPAEDHPVRRAVDRHRAWLHGTTADLLSGLGVEDPGAAADQLLMLRDGAMVHGYVSGGTGVADALIDAGTSIVASRARGRAPV
jgi:AcrR family transcriptional regulator